VPTQAQYLQMVENKTSCLPRMCLRMIAEQTGQSEKLKRDLIKFVNAFGAAFQIQDDVIAVSSEAYRKQRGTYAEDIQEGKRSLMVIHNYYYGWKGDRLVDILDMHTKDEVYLKEAVEIL
jgi:geranylgeranyl pyrophosphate synthase